MAKGKVFLVVGHATWGKSWTLRALTHGKLPRSAVYAGQPFVIKRMSNDDDLEGLRTFFRHLVTDNVPRAIAAFCPKLVAPDTSARSLIAILRPRFELFFWVQHQAFGKPHVIGAGELAAMRALGKVHVFRGRAPATKRAADLRLFINANS